MAKLDITVQDSDGDAVVYCPITVRNAAETAIIAGPSRTDENGDLSLELSAASYQLRLGPLPGYDFSTLTGTDGTTTGSGHPYPYTLGDDAVLILTCDAAAQRFDGYTFQDLQLAVLVPVEARYLNGQVSQEIIKLAVRAANSEIDARLNWSKAVLSLVSVEDQANYLLWDAPRKVLDVTYNDGEATLLLQPIVWTDYLKMVSQDTAASTPAYWSRWMDQLYLYPPPDTTGDAVLVYMTQSPPLLNAGTDTPALPAQYHRAIVELAISMACGDLPGLEQASAFYLQRFEAAMNALKPLPDVDRSVQRQRVVPGV